MRGPLPPLDAHAHVQTDIAPRELTTLGAVVFAVTRSPAEWAEAVGRNDEATVWGIGSHPGVAAALKGFDQTEFADQVKNVALVGEVGLDGKAKTSHDSQRRAFEAVLEVTAADPRMISVHSVAASSAVLDVIEQHPQPGVILHWWRGNADETQRAIELGCWFSLNGAEAARPRVLELVPQERVLTETDFPHTRRSDRAADRPGRVATIETALAQTWGEDDWAVRRRIWQNFRQLLDETGQVQRMPRRVRRALVVAGSGQPA